MSFLNIEELQRRLPASLVRTDYHVSEHVVTQAIIEHSCTLVPFFVSAHEIEASGYAEVCSQRGKFAIALSKTSSETGFPQRIFFGYGTDEELETYAVVEGIQAFGKPFIGKIETKKNFRRRGNGLRMLSVMNAASHAVYGEPVTSGPAYYLSDEGRELQEHVRNRYTLESDDNDYVVGKS